MNAALFFDPVRNLLSLTVLSFKALFWILMLGFANLFFLPIAAKLKANIQQQSRLREMILEGVVAIAEGENPRNIETKLQGYLI